VSRLLFSLQIAGPVTVSPLPTGSTPLLIAHINTPQGLRLLSALQS
jgi:hypothetical protein